MSTSWNGWSMLDHLILERASLLIGWSHSLHRAGCLTKDVLMMAWMDAEALSRTLREGRMTYFQPLPLGILA